MGAEGAAWSTGAWLRAPGTPRVLAADLCQEHAHLLTECEPCCLTCRDPGDDVALLVIPSGCIGHTDIFACAFSVDLGYGCIRSLILCHITAP